VIWGQNFKREVFFERNIAASDEPQMQKCVLDVADVSKLSSIPAAEYFFLFGWTMQKYFSIFSST